MANTTHGATLDLSIGKKEMEKELIKSMAGMYRATFKFIETFSPQDDYKYHDRYFNGAEEYVHLLEETDDKVSLQHILYVGEGRVIKHWRQDWIYENREFLTYFKDHEWHKQLLAPETVKGTWTQKVYQVDDCPRYQGYGTWVHVDGRHFWESVADAPLPRREYSIGRGKDYNVLKRQSHIEIFADGSWMIDQDNEKIFRNDEGVDTLICLEKGLENLTVSNYDKTFAAEWWKKNQTFWTDVRKEWEQYFETHDTVKIHTVINNKPMYAEFFGLSEAFSKEVSYDQKKAKTAIRNVMKTYVADF